MQKLMTPVTKSGKGLSEKAEKMAYIHTFDKIMGPKRLWDLDGKGIGDLIRAPAFDTGIIA